MNLSQIGPTCEHFPLHLPIPKKFLLPQYMTQVATLQQILQAWSHPLYILPPDDGYHILPVKYSLKFLQEKKKGN